MLTSPANDSQGATPFVVDLTGFNGPLDLLLSLIRDEQLDIYDIPVARICEQFLAKMHELQLNEAAEYLEMAARLIRIKAQMLLPRKEGSDDWEDPRAEVVDVLEHLGEDRRARFGRTYTGQPAAPPPAPLALSLGDLLVAVDRVLRAARRPTIHEVIPRALDVDGAIHTVRAILQLRARLRFRELIRDDAEPWEILSALLGLLELGKRNEVHLTQPRPFADVEIRRESAGEAA
ncbi:MAG TPA: segregation/condensation protein A [Gemmatimonadaceae bacterium]|nr:segregation/condensation protein A [Gemmatimonadaceae bacterium]